jgi:hypothetical protein
MHISRGTGIANLKTEVVDPGFPISKEIGPGSDRAVNQTDH